MSSEAFPGRTFSNGRPNLSERVSSDYCSRCGESGPLVLGGPIGRTPGGMVYEYWHLWTESGRLEPGCYSPKGLIVPDSAANLWVTYGTYCDQHGIPVNDLLTRLIPHEESPEDRAQDIRFLPPPGPRPFLRFHLGGRTEVLSEEPARAGPAAQPASPGYREPALRATA